MSDKSLQCTIAQQSMVQHLLIQTSLKLTLTLLSLTAKISICPCQVNLNTYSLDVSHLLSVQEKLAPQYWPEACYLQVKVDMLSLPYAEESDHCPEDNFVILLCICDHYLKAQDAITVLQEYLSLWLRSEKTIINLHKQMGSLSYRQNCYCICQRNAIFSVQKTMC